jgi:hypothetical protein
VSARARGCPADSEASRPQRGPAWPHCLVRLASRYERGEARPGRLRSRRQGPQARGSVWGEGFDPVQCCFAVRDDRGGPPLTCDPHLPGMTARARRVPAVPDAARTQHGPGIIRSHELGSTFDRLHSAADAARRPRRPSVVVRE